MLWYFESPFWPRARRAHMQRRLCGHNLYIIENLFVLTHRQGFGDFSLTGFDECVLYINAKLHTMIT